MPAPHSARPTQPNITNQTSPHYAEALGRRLAPAAAEPELSAYDYYHAAAGYAREWDDAALRQARASDPHQIDNTDMNTPDRQTPRMGLPRLRSYQGQR